MAGLDDSVFSSVLSAFRRRLTPQDITDFQSTTLEDLKDEITTIQRTQAQRRGFRNLNKIRPFINGIEQYSKVIEVFVNAKPGIMAFIWGPIKLCLQIASKLTEAFDALLDAYEKIGKSLPLFSKMDSLFSSQSYVQQVLVDVYEDILDFHKRAIIFFKQSAWRLAFKFTIHTFGDMFGDVIKKLERSKELLLDSASIAHYQEAQESRLLFAQEFETQLERTRQDRMLTVIDWLSPTSCEVDHEELQQKRKEFPDTTSWIFRQDSLRRWLQSDGVSSTMFWICGIPGAGKTVLFSSIVDRIKHDIPHSQIIFFYCKNRDPLKKTFDGIARSLIAQLLRLNPVSLDYLYEIAIGTGERHPSTFKTYRSILGHIISAHDFLFIGIDGLDECEKDDRGLILSLLDHVLKESSPQAKIKIFLTSQRMNDLETLLKPALRFDIKPHHVRQDIEYYVHRRALQLCNKFGLGPDKQSSITAEISNRSEGMFLLARLIMDNLIDQDNIEELEAELSTDILPKGIDEAYGRILLRLSKGSLKKNQERATRVLELIVTARYPLKIHELQGALSIRLEDMTVDFARRRSFTPFNELCGPIVEVHTDDTISLVHPTAKKYLVQNHSGPFIDLRASYYHMANLCAKYLNFKCFCTLHNVENAAFVAAGAYAFQEYATLNWIYHTQLVFKPDTTSRSDQELAALEKSCLLLKSTHSELLSGQRKALSSENAGQEHQDFRAELSLLRKTYESFNSILDDEQSEGSMPYPLRHLSQARFMIEESFITTNRTPAELMTSAYGTHVFKCSVISCPRFRHGFTNSQKRNRHQLTHRERIECPHNGCDFSILGFSTKQDLAKHLIEHKPLSDVPIFLKVPRCSLKKSLEYAIDQDDAVAVRALFAEGPDSLLVESDLLKRALNKKSCEATKVLLQVVPAEANTNSKQTYGELAMHLAAENGDEELANLVLAMGADLEPKASKTNPLTTAARRGHAHIVKLLLNQSARDLDPNFKWHQAPLLAAAEGGHEQVLRLLLDKHGKAYTQHIIYYKAILSAGMESHETAVRILIETGQKLGGTNVLPRQVRDLAPDVESMLAKIMELTAKSTGDKLQSAVSKGDLEKFWQLLNGGANINRYFPSKGTALLIAVDRVHLTLVHELLDRGADVNARNGEALQRASQNGHDGLVQLLLQWKADVNLHGPDGKQALHVAAENGHQIIVSLLHEAGADINAQSLFLDTALHLATDSGHISIVKLLLERNVDMNQKNLQQSTALDLAMGKHHGSIISLLLEHGAEANEESVFFKSAWHEAAKRGDLPMVKLLLGQNIDINLKDSVQQTALYLAVLHGHEDMARSLLENGADVNAKGGSCGTTLQAASRSGHKEMARLLLENGADVNAEGGEHGTALHAALYGGHEVTARLLVEKGADVNSEVGRHSTTTLQIASRNGYEKIAVLLLENGADVNSAGGEYGTALQAASHRGHDEIARLLLENGADANLEDEVYGTALQVALQNGREKMARLLLENGADVNAKGKRFGTALYAASYGGHEEMARLLLEKGADVNAQGGGFCTALQAASCNGDEEMVRLLLENWADVNAEGGVYGTALQAASYKGDEKIARLLLENGADVNLEDEVYGTALQAASYGGHEKMATLLLENGADVNAEGGKYGTALQAASYLSREEMARFLLENGANVNAKGGLYGTALQAASRGDYKEIARLLLEKGADVNAKGGYYGTALCAASYSGHQKMARMLSEKGADVNAEGGECGTALQAASRSGHEEIARFLLQKGADVNAKGGWYGTALLAASRNGHEKVARLLLENGAISKDE